ncbi:hypothetical protein [Pseudomonas sp. NMI1173_11]|uniref:hypothetical protein n=1 Tax=Pseudomonas sp. NMI1173_11 TaxID=2903145 RepID=UPI001E33E9CF|nr:hypothetical protein [Pseudomonas sp. NMI1173_11]MCE1001848.1 hypothetical protein [Pseudomonas sp. NMI1173_11]
MDKLSWFAQEIGVDGWLLLAVDLDMTRHGEPENMIGHRRAFHPFQLDEDPQALAKAIAEMTEIMGRLSVPPRPVSRACAFTPDLQEQQP